MAVTATPLDGQNQALVFSASEAANVFSLNVVTGAVTSSLLPATWLYNLSKNAKKLFAVTSTAQRQSAAFLSRLVSLGSVDATVIAVSASVVGDVATLVATPEAATTMLVALPYSASGGFSVGQTYPVVSGSGGGGTVTAADLGLSRFTGTIDPSVAVNKLVSVQQVTGILVLSDNRDVLRMPCSGVYQLDSAGQPCIRGLGEAAIPGSYAAGAEVFVGHDGEATSTPPAAGEVTQFIGMSRSPSIVILTVGEAVN
jgi:hypothetical protein